MSSLFEHWYKKHGEAFESAWEQHLENTEMKDIAHAAFAAGCYENNCAIISALRTHGFIRAAELTRDLFWQGKP